MNHKISVSVTKLYTPIFNYQIEICTGTWYYLYQLELLHIAYQHRLFRLNLN